MRGRRILLPGPELRVGADGVEVAERDRTEIASSGRVVQDLLDHRLGGRVGAGGGEHAALVDALAGLARVDGGGRAEHDARDAGVTKPLEQEHRLADVGVVVAERVGDGLRHHGAGRAVDDRVDVRVVRQQAIEQRRVGDVAHVEVAAFAEGAEALGEVVEDDDLDAGLDACRRDSGPDVSGAAGDQYLHRHQSSQAPGRHVEPTLRRSQGDGR